MTETKTYYTKIQRGKSGKGLGMGLGDSGGLVVVTSVEADSPADRANVIVDDVIATVDGKTLTFQNFSELLPSDQLEFELGVMREEPTVQPRFHTFLVRDRPNQPTGMEFGFQGDQVYVKSVEEGSPADKANLVEGDVIALVDGSVLTPETLGNLLRSDKVEFELGIIREAGEIYYTMVERLPKQPLGMQLEFEGENIIVLSIQPDSPAALANLSVGDIIQSIDDFPVTPDTVSATLSGKTGKFEVAVLRDPSRDQSAVTAEQIHSAFKIFDRDHSGKLAADELVAILVQPTGSVKGHRRGSMGTTRPFTEEEARKLISSFDLDGDGELNYDEFVAAFSSIVPSIPRGHSDWQRSISAIGSRQMLQDFNVNDASESDIHEAFSIFDRNGDGSLSADELCSLLTWKPKGGGSRPLTNAEATALIKKFDKNGDGVLQFEEFMKAFKTVMPLAGKK